MITLFQHDPATADTGTQTVHQRLAIKPSSHGHPPLVNDFEKGREKRNHAVIDELKKVRLCCLVVEIRSKLLLDLSTLHEVCCCQPGKGRGTALKL